MGKVKFCKQCGNKIVGRGNRAEYCSTECQLKHKADDRRLWRGLIRQIRPWIEANADDILKMRAGSITTIAPGIRLHSRYPLLDDVRTDHQEGTLDLTTDKRKEENDVAPSEETRIMALALIKVEDLKPGDCIHDRRMVNARVTDVILLPTRVYVETEGREELADCFAYGARLFVVAQRYVNVKREDLDLAA